MLALMLRTVFQDIGDEIPGPLEISLPHVKGILKIPLLSGAGASCSHKEQKDEIIPVFLFLLAFAERNVPFLKQIFDVQEFFQGISLVT